MRRLLRWRTASRAAAIALTACALEARAQQPPLERDRARLLELHEEQRRAHLEKDPELLLSQFADDFLMIADGDVTRPTREESRRRFERYFGSVEFLEWDDVEPPIVRISADGTLAHVIVQKRVRLIVSQTGVEDATRFAWLATYEKREGDWRLTSVASTERVENGTGAPAERPQEEDAAAGGAPSAAHGAPAGAAVCTDDPMFAELDFWLGHWEVFAAGERVGVNRIEKVLGGCAVVENWSDGRGGEGRSLFYVAPGTRSWRQVWVTDRAPAIGGVKEKERIASVAPGVRFQGEVPLPEGGSYLDRTTLTPGSDGSVRQHIEISSDGGGTWQTVFDGRYVKAAEAALSSQPAETSP